MKALAQEVVAKFGERLKPLRMTVKEFTGDIHDFNDRNLTAHNCSEWMIKTSLDRMTLTMRFLKGSI
jgi:regulator of sirC expression with transglutaminase-like and TPR domain